MDAGVVTGNESVLRKGVDSGLDSAWLAGGSGLSTSAQGNSVHLEGKEFHDGNLRNTDLRGKAATGGAMKGTEDQTEAERKSKSMVSTTD